MSSVEFFIQTAVTLSNKILLDVRIIIACHLVRLVIHKRIRGMFEMNCLLPSSSISTWGMIKTNTDLYRAIQYLHNGV